ncbi:MAG: thiopeptide-type bacteriocin biosynthesis protein [Flavobacteriaceae bacterium]|nr:thiopeptide-type bacteriocin biosynthesis protein [Flavobacteriaceae bacterium]
MKNKNYYFPFDEWLYIKIYCAELYIDTLLNNWLKKIIEEFTACEKIKSWYFLKYKDPYSHLRIRLKIKTQSDALEILNTIKTTVYPLMDNYIIWDIQIDTYKKELIRYGYTKYEFTETFFNIDSKFLLSNLSDLNSEDVKFYYNLKSSFELIKIFYNQNNDILNFIKTNETNFKNEFKVDKKNSTLLSKKYRKERIFIELLLNKNIGLSINLLNSIIQKEVELSNLYKTLETKNKVHLFDFISSHIHLNTNRCFSVNQRLYEMITYDFLHRYLISKIKRIEN